jgi:hypothetical protein
MKLLSHPMKLSLISPYNYPVMLTNLLMWQYLMPMKLLMKPPLRIALGFAFYKMDGYSSSEELKL